MPSLVATKGGYGGAGQGRPEVLTAQIEQSLRSLRTERIALYYLHRVDPETPLEESLGAIKAYVDRGAIGYVGVSEVSVEQIEAARAAAERLGVSENAVKLAWLLRRSPVVLPIPGTLSLAHLRENLAALDLDLGEGLAS